MNSTCIGRRFAVLFFHSNMTDTVLRYYEFRLPKVMEEGQRMDVFGVRFKVKGPQKDYTCVEPPKHGRGVCSDDLHRTDTAYERTFSADLADRSH